MLPPDSAPLLAPNSVKFTIRPVTSETDVDTLARIGDLSLKTDAFSTFRERYAKSIYDDFFEKITESLRDTKGQYFIFKAVLVSDHDEEDEETMVGFSHWRLGYVQVPKVDPFAIKREPIEKATSETLEAEAEVSNVAVAETDNGREAAGIVANHDPTRPPKSKPFYSDPYVEVSRKLFNSYIGTIRGKRHLYLHRLNVHPSYQRQGIGQRLLDWGVETAERENVVSWLFARPAGSRLYERNGWRPIQTTDVDVPEDDEDLHVAPIVSMLRVPRGRG